MWSAAGLSGPHAARHRRRRQGQQRQRHDLWLWHSCRNVAIAYRNGIHRKECVDAALLTWVAEAEARGAGIRRVRRARPTGTRLNMAEQCQVADLLGRITRLLRQRLMGLVAQVDEERATQLTLCAVEPEVLRREAVADRCARSSGLGGSEPMPQVRPPLCLRGCSAPLTPLCEECNENRGWLSCGTGSQGVPVRWNQ